jgi:hypothetical protein
MQRDADGPSVIWSWLAVPRMLKASSRIRASYCPPRRRTRFPSLPIFDARLQYENGDE